MAFYFVIYSSRAPLSFRAIKDLAPQKIRASWHNVRPLKAYWGASWYNVRPLKAYGLFRPTAQCDMAKSLIARKHRGSARVYYTEP